MMVQFTVLHVYRDFDARNVTLLSLFEKDFKDTETNDLISSISSDYIVSTVVIS